MNTIPNESRSNDKNLFGSEPGMFGPYSIPAAFTPGTSCRWERCGRHLPYTRCSPRWPKIRNAGLQWIRIQKFANMWCMGIAWYGWTFWSLVIFNILDCNCFSFQKCLFSSTSLCKTPNQSGAQQRFARWLTFTEKTRPSTAPTQRLTRPRSRPRWTQASRPAKTKDQQLGTRSIAQNSLQTIDAYTHRIHVCYIY